MKKLIALVLLTCSTYATAYQPVPCVDNYSQYRIVWQEIAIKDYGLALYQLNKINPVSIEDSMHQALMRLYVSLKIRDGSMETIELESIGHDVIEFYDDDED